ncbi:MAG: PEP-CTERM sorting domain-containing protein [Planctomycetota bacterium]
MGNSLTNDSRPDRLEATGAHLSWSAAGIIRSNSSLEQLWTNRNDPDLDEYGDETGGLVGALSDFAWDAVTFQYHSGRLSEPEAPSLFAEDVQAITDMVGLIDAHQPASKPTIYVYEGWVQRSKQADWVAEEVVTDATQTGRSRDYSDALVAALRAELVGYEIGVVPTGDAFYNAFVAIESGDVPGVTDGLDLYRDPTHASFDLGRYVAHMTTFATLSQTYPDPALFPEAGYPGAIRAIPLDTRTALSEIVWDTVTARSDALVPEPGVVAVIGAALGLGVLRRRVCAAG